MADRHGVVAEPETGPWRKPDIRAQACGFDSRQEATFKPLKRREGHNALPEMRRPSKWDEDTLRVVIGTLPIWLAWIIGMVMLTMKGCGCEF